MIGALAAAAAAISSKSPAQILSGNYNPSLLSGDLVEALGSEMGERALPINGDALTVALDVVQIWAVILTLGFTLIILFFLAFCVCSKRENRYDDFESHQGITTVKVCRNGGENGVHTAPSGASTLCSRERATDETSEASSRYTHKRELPAIPTNASGSNRETLQSLPAVADAGQGNVKLVGGVQVLPAGAMKSGGRAAVIKESIVMPGDVADGKQKNVPTTSAHSYIMVSHSQKEHAYAKVTHGNTQKLDTSNYGSEKLTKESSGKKCDKLESSNVHTSQSAIQNRNITAVSEPLERNNSMPAPIEPAVVIPAAMAISGQTRANEELPYMTPASLQQESLQQNYSGDSHDSRGYTSISVREPLAALKARQQQEGRQTSVTAVNGSKSQEPESEGYYMTVSDDSADETYACIDENSRNGGSETYARINLPPPNDANNITAPLSPTSQETFPPAPPSVDSLKHVVHSRQASAGSAASTGLSSPNAERRATKSPLPPVPQGDPDHYSKDNQDSSQKPLTEAITRVTDSTGGRSLEEMYAKVNKKRTGHSRGNSCGEPDNDGVLSNNSSRRSSTDVSKQLNSPTVSKSVTMTSSLIENSTESNTTRNMPSDISKSWAGGPITSTTMSNYEEIPPKPKSYSRETSDPGYETVKPAEPPYAVVNQPGNYPSYEVVRHQEASDMDSEHGYETLRHKESEPGYETVQDVTKISKARSDRSSTSASDYEAGYETVNRSTDAGYESVQSHDKPGYDPGYEELSGVHARSVSECDPNYEQLKFNTNSESGYEAISKGVEGNYELVRDYDTHSKTVSNDTGIPLYATVNKQNKISLVEEPTKMLDDILKTTETEHISLIEINDDLQKQPEPLPPLITGMIIKSNPESLPITSKLADTYPVTDSPEDVELPPPDLECLKSVTTLTSLSSGHNASALITQETTNLLASFSDGKVVKPLDVDLITGCYSNESELTVAPVVDTSEKSQVEKSLVSDSEILMDLIPENFPPPPTSMIEDISTQIMLPHPVDDICGNQEQVSQGISNNIPPLTDLVNFGQPPPINGDVNGIETEIPPISNDFPSLMDVLPPPQLDAIEASMAASNSTITVTVNPMAHMEDRAAAPPISSLIRAALSSESSSSTANGGSVESVVTVDVKNGIEVSTSNQTAQVQPPPPTMVSAESKDGHEGLTPV